MARTHRSGHPYSVSALPRSTIRAISSARSRVTSPSSTMPISAMDSASRAEVVVCHPISSQSTDGVPG